MPLDTSPYDALLLVSFGGPERAEDGLPFLENVTRGRGIPRERLGGGAGHHPPPGGGTPRERLEEVGEPYLLLGGRSPINDQNRRFIAAIEEDFRSNGIDLPVYWGNRNWDPYLRDAFAQMHSDGLRRATFLV